MTIQSIDFFGITHIGLVRKSNEDRYLIKRFNDESVLIAIADGLGGEVAGDYAAEIIREKLAGLKSITKKHELTELDQLARGIDRDIYTQGQSTCKSSTRCRREGQYNCCYGPRIAS